MPNLRAAVLGDTCDMMISDDYKDRFRAEYMQLAIRYGKLKTMLDNWDRGELNFKLTCPRRLYDMQIRAMKEYIAVLEARAAMEDVDIQEVR